MTKRENSWKFIMFPVYVILFGLFLYKVYPTFGTKFMGDKKNLAFIFLAGTHVLAATISLYSGLKGNIEKSFPNWILRSVVAIIGLIFNMPAVIYTKAASWGITIIFAPVLKVIDWWKGEMNILKFIVLLAVTIALLVFLMFAAVLYFTFIILDCELLAEFFSESGSSSSGGYSGGYQEGGSMGYSYDNEDEKPDYAGAALNFTCAYLVAKDLAEKEAERQEMIRKDPMSEFRP